MTLALNRFLPFAMAACLLQLAACERRTSDHPDAATDGALGSDGSPRCASQMFEETSIPMRDGQSLSAWLRRPTDPTCKLPTVLIQTPYDKEKLKQSFFMSP